MTQSDIFKAIDNHRAEIQKLGVRSLQLFGSSARGEAEESSDLDFLVEFESPSFDNYMDLKFLLEDLFGRNIDLVLKDTIKPRLRDSILSEAVHAPGF